MIGEDGVFTEEFGQKLPELLGDNFYNDPETKQQPTKMFENIKDMKGLVNFAATAQRGLNSTKNEMAEKLKSHIRIPAENAPDTEKADFNKLINKYQGVPATIDGYKLNIPQGESVLPEDTALFTTLNNAIVPAALEAGISPSKLSKVWDVAIGVINAATKAQEEQGNKILEQQEAKLKEKHGEKFNTFIEESDKALTKLKSGPALKEFLKSTGYDRFPAMREFLFEIAPLVNQGGTVFGQGINEPEKQKGIFTYEYDEHGKPI